jgi:hypothetical protein
MGYSESNVPFAPGELAIHFARHGHKFGIAGLTEAQYEQMAETFMFGAVTADMSECTRPNRIDRLRSELVKKHFGVAMANSNVIRTFYPPEQRKIAKHGGMAGFHAYECGRTNL